MDISLKRSERTIVQKNHQIQPEEIEAILLNYPSIIDCRVLAKECDDGHLQLAAYIVSKESFSDEKLHQFFKSHYANTYLPIAYVAITNMPLTESGEVDDTVLRSLIVINKELVKSWDAELSTLSELQQYSVMVQDKNVQCEPLHLQHLCPKWTSKTDNEEFDDIEFEDGDASDIPALSDGGPLKLDELLPHTLSEAFIQAQKHEMSGLVYLQQDGYDVFISYTDLLLQAKKIVTGLEKQGLQANDVVILQLMVLEEFVAAFWACLLAGVTPLTVAIAPTYESKNGVLDKLFNAWDLLNQPPIISSGELLDGLNSFQRIYNLSQLNTLSITELIDHQPAQSWYKSLPDEIAFLQLSSGSTGVSKCIPETHRAVIAHIQAATQVNQYHNRHVSLNWLPMDHVGPLLMYHVRDVYLGIRQIQVPPNLILNEPTLWLDYLEKYQVTHTWCANFGYKRVNDCLLEHPHKLWDLSSVQIFCNAGEQVTLSVLQDFILLTQKFQLNMDAIQPAYGMAEAATALTFCNNFDFKRHVHHIEKVSLNGNLSKVEKEGADTVAFIVQGPPSPGMKIRIVDKKNQLLQERKIGHVQLSGETIMAGYLFNDKANQEAFSDDGWYDTGDLGFLLEGELTITGREKDLIVVYGANYYCADIEAVVNDIPGVMPTFVAATGVDAESGTEQLAIFFVPMREELRRNIGLLEIIKTQVTLLLGINPSFIIPLSEAEFPKTTSGKIQRAKLKNHLLGGEYASILQEIDCYQRNENTLPNWFFKTLWRPHRAQVLQSDYSQGPYLIFLDEYGLGRYLAKELRDEQECILVEASDDYEQVNRHHYRIVPNNAEHYHLLFTSLVSHHYKVSHVLHLWNYKNCAEIISLKGLESTQKWVMCNFLLLIQNIIKHHDYEQKVLLYVITNEMQSVIDSDIIRYEYATLTGLIKTLPQEVPWLKCRHIDIPIIDNTHNGTCILQELKTIGHEQEVAYRKEQRYIKRLKLVEFERPSEKNIPLKQGGIYLISGGLGHIGLSVSQMLLERYQARLIIVGRTELDDIQDTKYLDGKVDRRIKSVQFLQQFSGDFRYYSVDICDQEQLELIVQEAEYEWGGELDGIFHLAGCEQQKLLKDETRESLALVLYPKVMGSWVLHQLLTKRTFSKTGGCSPIDKKLFIHFSSVNSHFGGEKSGAEAAANAFQNSFSHYQNQQANINSLCFAWSRWHESDMGKSQRAPLASDSGYYEMSQYQSILSLMIAMQHQQKFLLIGLNGAQRRIRYQLEMPASNSQEISTYFVSKENVSKESVSKNNVGQAKNKDTNLSAYAVLDSLTVSDGFQISSQCYLFRLKKMPLDEKGEIDQKKLVDMQLFDKAGTESFVPPGSETEQQLAWLWQDILSISQPSIHDNFFKLGGNSLQATVFTSRIRDIFHFDLSVQTIFKSPTIAEIAEILENKELAQEKPIPILPRDPQSLPLLSIGQERLWFLYQLAPDNPQYNIPVTVHIHGDLDIIALVKSYNQLIERHEPLRTRFTYRNNQAVQHIAKNMELSLSITDISGTTGQQQTRLQEIIQNETLKPFDITRLPLIRVKLYRLSDSHYVLFNVMHHIVADGWSMGVFFHELTSFYKAEKSELNIPLLPLGVQYSDFALWQRSWLSGNRLQNQMDYWVRQLADLPVLNLIPDRPRNKDTSNQGERHTSYVSAELNSVLIELSQQQETSLFMTLMSAFMMLCARYTGQDDIAIGTGIANRNRREIEPLIGFFTNTLVMRGDLSGDPDFITLLKRIKNMSLDAYEHQDLPFGNLVDALQPQREIGQNPLAQVIFVMQNSPTPVTDIPDIEFSPYEVESGLVKMDIEVNVYEVGGGLRIETEFNQELFDLSTIERMFAHYQLILNAITKNPQQAINTIPLLTPDEQQRLFDSETVIDKEPLLSTKCIHEIIEQIADTNPQATAVIFEHETLSYEQLNQKANQLARHLREQGVQKESLVGICIERSQEMIIALLAIFKAGGAYVPLDPAYPENRLQFILEDTALKVLLTQQSLKDKLPENQARMICIDSQWEVIEKQSSDNFNVEISGNNLAYIIFTSGSTGKPKGVLIEHKGLSNLIYAQSFTFGLTTTDRVLQFSSLNFDASIFEIVMALSAGAGLVMVNQRSLMFGAPLLRLLEQENISIATIPPSVLVTLPVEGSDFLPSLKKLIVAGEAPNPDVISMWSKNRQIFNAYGPTETTVWATTYLYDNEKNTPPIGRAIVNTQIYLLDKSGQPVPVGVPGEIHIGGIGVARGYLNRVDLSDERFILDPFSSESDAKMYCSGDLARYLPDGNIEYLGRIDQQVKIRGFRVEPGEIENRLRDHDKIKEAFIHVNKSDLQNPFLEAFITQKVNNTDDVSKLSVVLKNYLKEQLPPHMIPSSISVIEKIPLTPNGKLDYTQLAALKLSQTEAKVSPEVAKIVPEVADIGDYAETEAIIIQVITEKLHVEQVGIHSHFFEELGGTSLGMVHIHKELEKQLTHKISLIDLFEFPTIAQLTQYLTKGSAVSAQAKLLQKKMPERVNKQQTEAIAIIGMAGRFPDANSVDEFWNKIKQGEELIQKFTKEELLEAGVDKALLENPKYLRRKGALEGIENFDADFFNFTPKEAKITDPQQRLFLESVWEAFEHAGYDPNNYPGTVGVMGGVGSSNTYYQKNLQFSDFGQDVIGDYQLSLNNSADFLCTRVAYKLNLQGSATTIQSACSTSLVPSVMGYQALINYQADLIVAGGSAITLPAKSGYQYEDGMILSPDGHCRTFDAAAQGTVPGNAVGVVLLKRLEDAVRDGDTIYATIRGAAFNNDGDRKVGFTASGLDGQTRVISEALQTANVSPETISYVEAHGTATPLGDPIEIRALTKAWYANAEEKKKGYCAIGSVKSNVGHCDAAAGVTGLIKTVCSLYHKQIPPSLHYRNANPQIDFSDSPFYVSTELSEWKKNGTPRRAGVSSFGMGGTNAHVVMEEAPVREASSMGRDWLMFVTSAKTPTALEAMQERLIFHLKNHPEQNPADIAYTGQVGRHTYNYRQVIVCQNQQDSINALSTNSHTNNLKGEVLSEKIPEIIFLFPGQGTQYLNMGRDLYQSETIFREHLDQCAESLTPLLEQDIREIIYPDSEQKDKQNDVHGDKKSDEINSERLNQTYMAQPILFAIEYSLAQLLISWGIRPAMLAGHSLGEYTAACVAGVMSLEDCVKIVSIRARLMQSMHAGSMLAVPLSEAKIRAYLQPGLDLAAVNGPERCVVSGADVLIQSLQDTLLTDSIEARLLHTSHAYHSSMMEPILSEFYEALEDIEFQAPVIPLISSINGKPVQIMDRAYWTSQIRETVHFSDVLSQVYQASNCIILEVGPGNTLSSFARTHCEKPSEIPIYNTLRHPRESQNDNAYLLTTLAKLWIAGVIPDWSGFYQQEQRYRVAIPTYPFERKRYWVEATKQNQSSIHKAEEMFTKRPLDDWFYAPTWKRMESILADDFSHQKKMIWLIFSDDCGLSKILESQLQKNKHEIILVKRGKKFSCKESEFQINPEKKQDYLNLIKTLKTQSKIPEKIIYCWTVSDNVEITDFDLNNVKHEQTLYFYAVIYLVQAFGLSNITHKILLSIISNHLQSVIGDEILHPQKATLLGLCKTIPEEYHNIKCSSIDIVIPEKNPAVEFEQISKKIITDLYSNDNKNDSENIIAIRGGNKWVQSFEPIQANSTNSGDLFSSGGVYVITGGLGGMGLSFAEHIALASREKKIKLVLISRSFFLEESKWQPWIDDHGLLDVTSKKIQILQKIKQTIEPAGGELLLVSADIGNLQQMREALIQAKKGFNRINGVIHTAGVAGGGVIQLKSREMADKVFVAKLQGTLVLDKLTQKEPLDFMVLCSSLVSTIGILGQVDYCSANAFQDAYAFYCRQKRTTKTVSINWDAWQQIDSADETIASSTYRQYGILADEGFDVLKRFIDNSRAQVLVSTSAFSQLKAKLEGVLGVNLNRSIADKSKQTDLKQQENNINYCPPDNDIQCVIIELWQSALGIESIGIRDDFFELGGDSLTATQIVARLIEKFPDADLSPNSLLIAPSVVQLSKIIETETKTLDEDDHITSEILVTLQKGTRQSKPLFLIHPVGGQVYYYRELVQALGSEQTVYGFQAQGLNGKRKPLNTVEAMAAQYIQVITSIQPEGPYLIGGASFGGMIAYEIAQQLQVDGKEISLLTMIDAPSIEKVPHALEDNIEILTYLINMNEETFPLSMEELKKLNEKDQLELFLTHAQLASRLLPDTSIDQLRHYLLMFKANQDAMFAYQSEVYQGDVLYFRALTRDRFNPANPESSWLEIVTGEFQLIDVSGNHLTMMQAPNVHSIARRLQDEINNAD